MNCESIKWLFVSWLFIAVFPLTGQAHELPPGFAALQIADGLDPVSMTLAPDGRIFFTEKNGRVRIIENGEVLLDPFIEIEVDNFNERGLSGIAVDPDFPNSPYVYLYYTVPNADHNRLSRFRADGNFALPGSEEILLELDTMAGYNHNAGALHFADDGSLFIAVGDGKKIEAAQSLNSLLGKILRIYKDGSIPADNPFYDQTNGKYRSIWAMGHRNPFAMHYQSGTGRLFTTDVGNHRAEELNEIFKGQNYGWPALEGNIQDQAPPANYQAPLLDYDHNFGCAAVGITTYQPSTYSFPTVYWDKLFFTDYCNGKIMTFDQNTGEVQDFATAINRPLNLLVAPDGSMYFMARAGFGDGSDEDNTASSNGSIWRIFYTGNNAPFIAVQPKNTLVSNGENARFEIAVSGATPLFFDWQINGQSTNHNSALFTIENAMLSDSGSLIRCIVSNLEGSDTSETALLQVTSNQRPQIEILQPSTDYFYSAGDTLNFSAIVEDPEDGIIPSEQLTWKIDFHHNAHTHPALGPVTGIDEGTLIIPKIGEVSENVWFRINASISDSQGLSQTTQQLVFPIKSDTQIKTQPPGLPVFVNGALSNSPILLKSVVGVIHDISIPSTAVTTDSVYVFKEWSIGDDGSNILFEAPSNAGDLVGIYESVQALADGQGLRASYYKDQLKNFTYQEPYVFRRIDPVIDFDWGLAGPDEDYLGEDYFLVKWEGFIQAPASDTFQFHLITNDGARLRIDEKLIIDKWFGQGTNEYEADLYLEEGEMYPIELDFFEAIGDATVQLSWSTQNMPRTIVPSTQLFPAIQGPTTETDQISLAYFPNPLDDQLTLKWNSPSSTIVSCQIRSINGQIFYNDEIQLAAAVSESTLSFEDYPKGIFIVTVKGPLIDYSFEIIKQ